jgi:hypothetical protein
MSVFSQKITVQRCGKKYFNNSYGMYLLGVIMPIASLPSSTWKLKLIILEMIETSLLKEV